MNVHTLRADRPRRAIRTNRAISAVSGRPATPAPGFAYLRGAESGRSRWVALTNGGKSPQPRSVRASVDDTPQPPAQTGDGASSTASCGRHATPPESRRVWRLIHTPAATATTPPQPQPPHRQNRPATGHNRPALEPNPLLPAQAPPPRTCTSSATSAPRPGAGPPTASPPRRGGSGESANAWVSSANPSPGRTRARLARPARGQMEVRGIELHPRAVGVGPQRDPGLGGERHRGQPIAGAGEHPVVVVAAAIASCSPPRHARMSPIGFIVRKSNGVPSTPENPTGICIESTG